MMRKPPVFILSSAFLLSSISMISQTEPAVIKADGITMHANSYTGVTGASSFHEVHGAQAIAVRHDRVLAVGTDADMLKLKGPSTSVIDLQGHFVMPGFNDAHMHLTDAGFKKLTVDLTGARSLEEFRARIRKRVETAEPNEWIVGSGWDETLWPVKEVPTRWDIDEVTTEHPVYVERIDGHVAVANTLALKIARVTLASKDPEGGEIGRDISGQPNGILREKAKDMVSAVVPAPTPDNRRQAIEAALQDIASSGITSVQDYSHDSGGDYWDNFQIFEQLEHEGKLTARISEWLPFDEPLDALKK